MGGSGGYLHLWTDQEGGPRANRGSEEIEVCVCV